MNTTTSRCYVLGCLNSDKDLTGATFYEFPEELQEEWLIAIGRSRDTFVIDELVCSEHFKSTDFENDEEIKTLKQGTIPSLNLPTESEEELGFIDNSQLNKNNCDETEHLSQKHNSFKKAKPVKVLNNVVCIAQKPSTGETYEYETAPLNTIAMFSPEESQELNSMRTPEIEEFENEDECHLEAKETANCRTCLCEFEPQGSYSVTDKLQENKTVRDMIVYCVPQMASTILDSDLVCSRCLENIKFCATFIENCLEVEAELQMLENQDDHIVVDPNVEYCSDEESPPSETYKHISVEHSYVQETEEDQTPVEMEFWKDSDYSILNDPCSEQNKCVKCDRTFKTKNNLLDHIRRVHSGSSDLRKGKIIVFDCEFCEKSFLTKLGFDLHLRLSHRDVVDKSKEMGGCVCKECGGRFATLVDLWEHKQQEHGFTCRICRVRFDTRHELNIHNNIHPKNHLCHVCGKGFKNRANLKSHMLTHNDPNSLLCHECGQGFKSRLSLDQHFKQHDSDSKFLCDKCPSVFHRKCNLDMHKKLKHLGTREFKCTICDKKFCYKANLTSHCRLKHSEVKPFQCERCGVRFARSDYLRRHNRCGEPKKRRTGLVKRKYLCRKGDSALITCKLCDKVFKDVQILRLHVKTHTKLRKYKCRICNLTFTTSNNRDRHEKVHEDVSRLFRCEVCFKRMETQAALDEHCIKNHEYSKKYKCHVCEESFNRKYLLHSHVAENHGDVEDFEKEKEVLYKVVLQDYLVDN